MTPEVQRAVVHWLGVLGVVALAGGIGLLATGAPVAAVALVLSVATTAVGIFGGAAIFGRAPSPQQPDPEENGADGT